jgi:hypothetical protein
MFKDSTSEAQSMADTSGSRSIPFDFGSFPRRTAIDWRYERGIASACLGQDYYSSPAIGRGKLEVLEGQALANVLLRRYSRSPRGWSFLVAPAKSHGFYDAIVSNQSQAWQLKMDSIFKPVPLIVGSRTDVDHARIGSLSPLAFGYRELDPTTVMRILQASYESGGGEGPETNALDLTSILGSEPVVPRFGRNYAQGPFVFTKESLVGPSDRQEAVDQQLTSDLLRLFRRRYPGYG